MGAVLSALSWASLMLPQFEEAAVLSLKWPGAVNSCGCGKGLSVHTLLPPGPPAALFPFAYLLPNYSREERDLPICTL
jgi:hypothetical protein